jgi:hypothetical protein
MIVGTFVMWKSSAMRCSLSIRLGCVGAAFSMKGRGSSLQRSRATVIGTKPSLPSS